jgi:hypothetical protein
MNALTYLMIALGFMVAAYALYRGTFLKKPKSPPPSKPHFTLKIEPE